MKRERFKRTKRERERLARNAARQKRNRERAFVAERDRWERNRARRGMMEDAEGLEALRRLLTGELALRVGMENVAREGEVRLFPYEEPDMAAKLASALADGFLPLVARREHYSRGTSCELWSARSYTLPGMEALGAGVSYERKLASGRTWEALLLDVRARWKLGKLAKDLGLVRFVENVRRLDEGGAL